MNKWLDSVVPLWPLNESYAKLLDSDLSKTAGCKPMDVSNIGLNHYSLILISTIWVWHRTCTYETASSSSRPCEPGKRSSLDSAQSGSNRGTRLLKVYHEEHWHVSWSDRKIWRSNESSKPAFDCPEAEDVGGQGWLLGDGLTQIITYSLTQFIPSSSFRRSQSPLKAFFRVLLHIPSSFETIFHSCRQIC